jgi:Ser/Thr protein kinase RdoA (MazF antagonist)
MIMIEKIVSHFALPGLFHKAEKFGSGLINDTYLCEFRQSENSIRKYILQRINISVFKHPEHVMANIDIVSSHIVRKLRLQGVSDPHAITPALIRTLDGSSWYRDLSGGCWRMFYFIESGIVFDTVRNRNHAFEIGRGLGKFQALVSDLAPENLHDTLPGFHHTERYLEEYDDALVRDCRKRAEAVRTETEFVAARRHLAPLLTDLMKSGRVSTRVVHNDPKVNNVMIDSVTSKALCMLDLDTVKSGVVLFDFGDCVRSAANPAGEDAPELASVSLDISLFEAVAQGYLQEACGFLTAEEIDLLPLSVNVITFELGIRFLADYLRGDTYFKVQHSDHNLHRARVQFKLLESIEAAKDRMSAIIKTGPACS